ncbi:MAG TPA: outer membrane lipoprotein-sorting protein [Candidatus Acidoferrales bacterium]|nr:outer membrane lipoprotein-sorting protein [Candidatus Acidoferrales bacterium]
MRTRVVVALVSILACGRTLADTEDLHQFLHSAEEATQVAVPLRADGQLEVDAADGTRRDQVAVILRPPADTYIELHQEGIKSVLLSKDGKAYRLAKGAAKADDFPLDAGFADSDFTREDLEPFRMARYKDARISDLSGAELTVTLYPDTSQYSLVVVTFDRDKKVPIKTLYYHDTLNNLVKMERSDGWVLVGRKWLPTTMSMESFKLKTHSTLSLHWSQEATFPPELFDPVFLTHASGIVWPAAATTPAP